MNPSKLLSISGKSTTQEIYRQRVDAKNLLDYINRCRTRNTLCDVTIVVGKERFRANRIVLSCYSKFFERMFETNMKEKYEDSVEIKDMDEATMKTVIDFIYTGTIKINTENVCSLLDASEFLQLHDSKQFCLEFLELAISVESCFTIHTLSDRYGNDELKVKVKQFIDDNFAEIVTKDDYKNLSKEEVATIISNHDAVKVPVATIYKAVVEWTRCDVENRRTHFYDLLKLVDLSQLPLIFLEEVVSSEILITENLECTKRVLQCIVNYNKKLRIKESGSRILSLGGSKTLSTCKEIFNLLNNPVKYYPDLPAGVDAHCSVALDGYVYVIGGQRDVQNGSTSTNLVHRMNLKEKVLKWEEVASLNEKRHLMGAAVLNGDIFAVGGADETATQLSTSEYFTPAFDKWQNIAPMKQSRSGNALVSCKGCIYAIGGLGNDTFLDAVEQFQPGNEAWDDVTPLQVPRCWLAAVAIDGFIYAIGGQSGAEAQTRLKSVEKYDFTNKTWSYVKEMNVERAAFSACVVQGKIYVSGGVDRTDCIVMLTECYDPTYDVWTVVEEVEEVLYNHAIVAV